MTNNKTKTSFKHFLQTGGRTNYGTRSEVMSGKAYQTTGKLKKKDLMYNKKGDIVSVKLSNIAKKVSNLGGFIKNVVKGKFKLQPKKGTKLYNQTRFAKITPIQSSTDLSTHSSTDSSTDSSTYSTT